MFCICDLCFFINREKIECLSICDICFFINRELIEFCMYF